MKTAQKLLVMNQGGAVDPTSWVTYITDDLAAIAYWRFNEASGNLINYGSAGSALNSSAVSGATQGQTGLVGASEAYDFDKIDDYITIPNHASIANLTTQAWAFLFHPDSRGEANLGAIFQYGTSEGVATNHSMRWGNNSAGSVYAYIGSAGTKAWSVASNGQVDDVIGAWSAIFMDYDDSNELGNGRKIRLFKYVLGSSLTQLTLSTNQALVGSVSNQTGDLTLMNRPALDITFDGLVDETLVKNTLWTSDEMNTIAGLWGL